MKESETKDLIISLMTENDVEEASLLEEKTFSMPWKPSDFWEMVRAPYAYFFVARLGGKLVGTIGLRDIAGEGEITNVAVDEAYKRRGIASKLLQKAIDQCGQLEIKDITLEVRVSNEPAISLYEKFGFRSEGIRPSFYENPKEDAMIMWRRESDE